MPTLIIDADDTLWENETHYRQSIADFAALMVERGFDLEEAHQIVAAVERERVPKVGYAPEEFACSLTIAYQRLCESHNRPVEEDVAETALRIGRRVLTYPIELLDGVGETVKELSGRHRLILLTKGAPAVQEDKLARSGLARFFDGVHVVVEKDAPVFRDLIKRYGLEPDRTWMVGNSPRSDVNPAVEAGLRAVYVPHTKTWDLEVEEVVDSERVTVVESFSELASLFADGESAEAGDEADV